jgi:hypothetical protein
MPKQKSETAVMEPLDTVKPLVKDFVDPDKNLNDFLTLRLPHVPHSRMAIKQVYQNKGKTTFRYRINYWVECQDAGSTISTGQIVKSMYVEVSDSIEGYVLTDLTDRK